MYYLTVYNEPVSQPAEPENLDVDGQVVHDCLGVLAVHAVDTAVNQVSFLLFRYWLDGRRASLNRLLFPKQFEEFNEFRRTALELMAKIPTIIALDIRRRRGEGYIEPRRSTH